MVKFDTIPLHGRRTYPVSAVADTFCLRPWRQMQQLLLRHRSTPPDALARDHDRQQVSWLAGLGPSSRRPFGLQWYLWYSTNRLQLRGQRGIAYLNTRTAFPWLAFAGTTTRDCAPDRDPSQPSNLSHFGRPPYTDPRGQCVEGRTWWESRRSGRGTVCSRFR